jgi:uncharacterized protein involved in outer membrane biogenesis
MIWLRRLGWTAAALVLLMVVGWLALPSLLLWQLPPRLSEALGRPVTIGKIELTPWTLEFAATDIAIGGPAGSSEPLLTIGRAHADLSISSLFRRVPVVEEIEIDAPVLRVARTAEGRYDIDDLLARFAPDPAAPPAEPARFAIYNLQIRDGRLRFDDRPVERVHSIDGLRLALPFISNLPAEVEIKVEPRLAFRLNGTAFDTGAQATPFAKTKAGTLQLAVRDLDLARYGPYLPEALPARITRGSLTADIVVQFAVPHGGAPSVSVQGTAEVRDAAMNDAAGQPLLDWQRLQVALRGAQPLARKVAIESLRIEGARVHASRDAAGQINWMRLAAAGAAPSSPSAASVPSSASSPSPSSSPSSSQSQSQSQSTSASPSAATASMSAAGSASTPPVASASATAPGSAPTGAGGPAVRATAGPPAWQVSLDNLDLEGARVLWNDGAVAPAAALQLDGVSLTARQLQWPRMQPVALTLKGTLREQADAAPALAVIAIDGPVTDRDAKLNLALSEVSIAGFAPYLAGFVVPTLEGRIDATAQLDWSGAADAPRLQVVVPQATIDGLRVREGQGRTAHDAVQLKQLAVADLRIDALARSVAIGSLRLAKPALDVARGKDGKVSVERWLVADETTPPARVHAATRSRAAGAQPAKGANASHRGAPSENEANVPTPAAWRVQLNELGIDGGSVRWTDALVGKGKAAETLRAAVSELNLSVRGLTWPAVRGNEPAEVQLSARVAGLQRERGTPSGLVRYQGRLGIEPLQANGRLRIDRFPVHLFAPYAADRLPVSLLRAEAGYSGSVALRQDPAGLTASASGDVLLGDVHVATLPDAAVRATVANTDELLTWQALSLKGLKVALKPNARPQVQIGEAALTDFYARLVVTEEGRLNLQDVVGREASAPGAPAAAASAATPNPNPASARNGSVVVATTPAPSTELPVDIRIGRTRLENGRVDFRDRFVKPNYSAALTQLNGAIGGFASDSREMATVELRGRAEGTALLEITGRLNPLVRPLALDIKAKATDLELAPLSPYAGKYAGYAIERGKLSMDVAYRIDADGRLEATNQVVLNQLTFGDRIESKDATKLPVRLAVALLKDKNGVIDINLPVSGSINDPQFSVGGLIWKVIVNLLTKVLTSPFALLSGGGGDDLSLVEFVPGTAVMTAGGASAIDKVAKALTERPALKMTVTGAADPVSEREAFQRAAIDARLRAEARREGLRSGAPASAASAASAPPPLGAEERNRLLEKVYQNTELPDKPRNALGFAKSVPAPEMEALLMKRVLVTSEAARELALQRGITVRDALIAKGLPNERLFLAAPKLRATGEGETGWTPRVQLSLSTN